MKIKALLVDDEAHARTLFKRVLDLMEHKLEIVGEAENLPQAIQSIHALKPDVVFMDIDMPNFSGLQIQEFFQTDRPFKLVYVTAHADYAIEALRGQAFDYLTKPIELDDLQRCLKRLEEAVITTPSDQVSVKSNHQKLTVQSHQGTLYIDLADIVLLEASAMYSIVHTDNDQVIISKPLKEFAFLENNKFYRVHRSYMINTEKVKKINSVDALEVEMINGEKIPVSRKRKDEFKTFMKKEFGV